MSDPDPRTLLERHKPLVRYDAQEAYFADAAAEWTDNPGNRLISLKGEVLAAAAGKTHRLSLGFLGAGYEGSSADDAIACTGDDYAEQYATLRTSGDYRNRVYGRVAEDSQGATWIQYWFFYFYNDAGFLGFGAHEGDWEMVQLRLGDDGPDVAVYAQHKEAEARPFAEVERAPDSSDRPVVYSARGSHASVLHAGKRWTGVWFDHAVATASARSWSSRSSTNRLSAGRRGLAAGAGRAPATPPSRTAPAPRSATGNGEIRSRFTRSPRRQSRSHRRRRRRRRRPKFMPSATAGACGSRTRSPGTRLRQASSSTSTRPTTSGRPGRTRSRSATPPAWSNCRGSWTRASATR